MMMNNDTASSPALNPLIEALVKVQGALPPVKRKSENPYHQSHYADLESIVSAAQKLLSENGLCVTHSLDQSEGSPHQLVVITTLWHVSGGRLASSYPIIFKKQTDSKGVVTVKDDPQSLAACITYARRVSFAALVGVVTCDDDDGELAMGRGALAEPKKKSLHISDEQRSDFHELKTKIGLTDVACKQWLSDNFGAKSTAEILQSDYAKILAALSGLGEQLGGGK
jgi:hypothetical protein